MLRAENPGLLMPFMNPLVLWHWVQHLSIGKSPKFVNMPILPSATSHFKSTDGKENSVCVEQ